MNIREELNNFRAFYNAKSDEELAKILKISKRTIDAWILRKKIPAKWQLQAIKKQKKSQLSRLFILIEKYADAKLIDDLEKKLLKIKAMKAKNTIDKK